MSDTPRAQNAGCGRLPQYTQPEANGDLFESCHDQVDPGNVSVRGHNGRRDPTTNEGRQMRVSPYSDKSNMSTNVCYPKENLNDVEYKEEHLLAVSKNIYDAYFGASQLSKEQTYNREELKVYGEDCIQSLRVSRACADYNPYNSYDYAYCRNQQWTHRSMDFQPNSDTCEYQEKALDLSGRTTISDQVGSCHDQKCHPTFTNNPEAVSSIARSKVALSSTDDVLNLSGTNTVRSQHAPVCDNSIFKPHFAKSYTQDDGLSPLNTLPTQLETATTNVPTIHRPIPVYPQHRFSLLSGNLNLFHVGARPLHSTIMPPNYQVSNSYANLLDQFQKSCSLPWSTQGINCTYMPRTTEHHHGAVNHVPWLSDDPNKCLTTYLPPYFAHGSPPTEPISARIEKLFSYPYGSLQNLANDEQFLLNHLLWKSAFQNSQSGSTPNSEINSQKAINISGCPQLDYGDYSARNVIQELSSYRTSCYKGGNSVAPVTSQSWIDSGAHMHGHAFLPVYNHKREEYNLDNIWRHSDIHESSVKAIFNEHLQSSSLPLAQDGDSSVPVDLRKTDDSLSRSMRKQFHNNLLKNSACGDVPQGTNSANNGNNLIYPFGCNKAKSYRQDSVTDVNRLTDSNTRDETKQACKFRKVFNQRPQTSNKLKRKLTRTNADNAKKLARRHNIATLVPISQANSPPSTTHTQTNSAPLCPMGRVVNFVENQASIDETDLRQLCVSGQFSCENVPQCSESQLKTADKRVGCDHGSASVSAHTLQCTSATAPSSSRNYCNKCPADLPGDPTVNSFTGTETYERNYCKFEDQAKRRRCFKKTLDVTRSSTKLGDNRTQQNSSAGEKIFNNYSIAAICSTTKKNQKSPRHNTQQKMHLGGAETLIGKPNDTHTHQQCQNNYVKSKRPSTLTMVKQSGDLSELPRLVVNSNTVEQSRTMSDMYKTQSATHITTSKQNLAIADHFAPSTARCGNTIIKYPCTFRGNKKKASKEDGVGNNARLFQCKDCDSSHRSFSALLQHQSRGCESTMLSSTPVHATDCVGSYMRYDTSWVGDKCQCTPCPICKGIFGSKFRVFSHLQRGCYKEKVLPRSPDSLGAYGCKSTFPKTSQPSGKCGLQCCLFRSEAEKIDERVPCDLQCPPSIHSNIQGSYRPASETSPPSSFSENDNIKQMAFSKTKYQQSSHLANNIKSSVPIGDASLTSSLLHLPSNKDKEPTLISGNEEITRTEKSSRSLPATSVIKDFTANATPRELGTEIKASLSTSYSSQNERPCLEQLQCQVDNPVQLPSYYTCGKLLEDLKTAVLDDAKSLARDNTKTFNTSFTETGIKPLISGRICIPKNTPEIKICKEEVDVKQEIDMSVEDTSTNVMDQSGSFPGLTVNPHDMFPEHILAQENADVKYHAVEDVKCIFPLTSNLGICEDFNQRKYTKDCSTRTLHRGVLCEPVMSHQESLLHGAISTTDAGLAYIPTCPSVASNINNDARVD